MHLLRKYWYIPSFIVWVLSWWASWWLFIWEQEVYENTFWPRYGASHVSGLGLIYFTPGLAFGIITVLWFLIFFKQKISFLRIIAWIISTMLSFLISYCITSLLSNSFSSIKYDVHWWTFSVMWFIWGFITTWAFHVFVKKLSWKETIALFITTTWIPILVGDLYMLLFFPWQGVVTTILSYAIHRDD